MGWLRSLGVTPMIKALRQQFEATCRAEIKRNRKHFTKTDWEQLERFSHSLINKLLHIPTTRLRESNEEGHSGQIRLEAIRDLFNLQPPAESADDPTAPPDPSTRPPGE